MLNVCKRRNELFRFIWTLTSYTTVFNYLVNEQYYRWPGGDILASGASGQSSTRERETLKLDAGYHHAFGVGEMCSNQ